MYRREGAMWRWRQKSQQSDSFGDVSSDAAAQPLACIVKKTSSMTMPTMKGRRLVTPPLGGCMNIAPGSRNSGRPARGALETQHTDLS